MPSLFNKCSFYIFWLDLFRYSFLPFFSNPKLVIRAINSSWNYKLLRQNCVKSCLSICAWACSWPPSCSRSSLRSGARTDLPIKHNGLCSRRVCDLALAPSTDHMLRRVHRHLTLRLFCNQQALYQHQLLQHSQVIGRRLKWRKVHQVQARSSFSI